MIRLVTKEVYLLAIEALLAIFVCKGLTETLRCKRNWKTIGFSLSETPVDFLFQDCNNIF